MDYKTNIIASRLELLIKEIYNAYNHLPNDNFFTEQISAAYLIANPIKAAFLIFIPVYYYFKEHVPKIDPIIQSNKNVLYGTKYTELEFMKFADDLESFAKDVYIY
jgi:hypothetical protein